MDLVNLNGGAFVGHLAEAVAAIYWTVTTGPEWNQGIVAAFGTNDRVHLAGRVLIRAAAATPLLSAADRPAASAALGLVGESAGVEKLLLARGKYKLCAALHAHQGPVC